MTDQKYPTLVPGSLAYVRRGSGGRRDPSDAEHVEIVTSPRLVDGAWRVLVRTVRVREGGTAGGTIGEERDISPSRLVPVSRITRWLARTFG